MRLFLGCLLVAVIAASASAGEFDRSSIVTPDELAASRAWIDARVAGFSDRAKSVAPVVKCLKQGWGLFHQGWSVNDNPLKLNGKIYTSGFGSHADSLITIDLPANAAHFSGMCGVDDTPEVRQAEHPVRFTIDADGRRVFDSGSLHAADDPQKFDLEVRGIRELSFSANIASDDESYTPADWVDLKLTDASGATTILGQRHAFQEGVGPMFDFMYDGTPSSQINGWNFVVGNPSSSPSTISQQFTWTDPKTGLQCKLDIKRYLKYPVVEWVQHFKNTGMAETPILENIRPIDVRFPAAEDLILHHNTGDHAAADSYQPFDTPLSPGDTQHFAPEGGRPTDTAWPYFNIERPEKQDGLILAIGWPGQWAADISRDGDGALHVAGGQKLTHLRLHPGEEIRTPLCVAMFYLGDAMRAQNMWRRWMLDCNVPRNGNTLPAPIHAVCMGLLQSQQTEFDGINRYFNNGADLTHWWMDAGWYPCADLQWPHVGTWTPDPRRFPNGIAPVMALAHSKGMKTILWFEPERVTKGSWLFENHSQWLLHNSDDSENLLLDLRNPEAQAWLLGHIDDAITHWGIDVYRQDFNVEPLPYWRQADRPDRQGMTEMRHVEGLLAFWDELRRRHPNLIIDMCASGGRRLDLETLRRGISLWTSDDSEHPLDTQCHTYGIASWIPYYGTGIGAVDAYTIRSAMLPTMQLGDPPTGSMDWNLFHRETANWKILSHDQLGDYYPLLPYSMDAQDWIAWQFDRADEGAGAVQAFRREQSPYLEARFRLHNLDRSAKYFITNVDDPDHPQTMSGEALCGEGIDVHLEARPGAALFFYKRLEAEH